MTADALAGILTGFAAVVVPVVGGWAWKTQASITTLETKEEADKEFKQDMKDRLTRIEDKLDGRPRDITPRA